MVSFEAGDLIWLLLNSVIIAKNLTFEMNLNWMFKAWVRRIYPVVLDSG